MNAAAALESDLDLILSTNFATAISFLTLTGNTDNSWLIDVFFKEDFIRKSTKTTLLTKYIHICTSHHQLHLQTLHIIQNEVLTMDIKHLSNRQLSRKVVQLIYVGCPRIMQIYLVYTLELVWDYKTIVWNAGQISY